MNRIISRASDIGAQRITFLDVRNYGAIGDGSTDDAGEINSAISAAVAATRFPTVYLPGATYGIASPINLKDGVRLFGDGYEATEIIALSGFSGAAMLLGASADTVSDVEIARLAVNGNYGVSGGSTLRGIQITNGARPHIHQCKIHNVADAAILLQGINGGGTPDAVVTDNWIDATGLADGTTGFGVLVKDASPRALIADNRLTDIKGGMGIGGSGTSTDLRICRNDITMQASTTGFEPIGITSGCVRSVISDNQCHNSQDNGISCSAGYSTVTGNLVDGALNHGIACGGAYNIVTGNVVRNAGQLSPTDGLTYGGITTDGGSYTMIAGNVIVDDQNTPTMAYGIKLVTSGGRHRIGPNVIHGFATAAINGAVSSDVVIDSTTETTGYTFGRLFVSTAIDALAGSPLVLAPDTRINGRGYIGPSEAHGSAQFNVLSNATDRVSLQLKAAPSQTADFLRIVNESDAVLARMDVTGQMRAASLGVGNSASASTLGTVTKKIEVFDASGVSLGFVPVYDAIT